MTLSTVSTAEIEATRFHLGYGNILVGGYPYTPDGFRELFAQVIQPNLQAGAETSATTAIAAGASVAVTPLDMTGIAPYARLVVDVGPAQEIVTVAVVTLTTFTATFANAHAAAGYPIAVESGVTRLRALLASLTTCHARIQSPTIANRAGISKVDEIEFQTFNGKNLALRGAREQYRQLQADLSSLVRVPVRQESGGGRGQLEVY